MGLSSEEQKLLKKLQRKAEEPDAPAIGRSVNVSVDLGDEKQVQRAHKLGLLSGLFDADDADDDDDDDDDDDAEDTPRRRGYFDKES
jgi:hypothetical protein